MLSRPTGEAAPSKKSWPSLLGELFSGSGNEDQVTTSLSLPATPDLVWHQLLMYEEVPLQPPLLLRKLLPYPIRSEGDKSRVGSDVHCLYREGDLIKTITKVEPGRLLAFDVLEQHLGVENCVKALGGSYELRPSTAGINHTEVVLTTRYVAYLQPRLIWRPVEHFLGHLFHSHLLEGMRSGLLFSDTSAPTKLPPETIPCTTSASHSPRS